MYKQFKPSVQSENRNSQQSPRSGANQSMGSTSNGPISTGRKSSLNKTTSFKSDQSTPSIESASDKKKKKK